MTSLSAVQHDSLSPVYWQGRWESGDTQWHKEDVNSFLIKCLPALDPVKAAAPAGRRPRIFVPLCGASVDMAYLLHRGWHVIGLDAVERPLRSFMSAHEDQLTNIHEAVSLPTSTPCLRFSAAHVDLFCVDLFSPDLTPALLGGAVDAVWDRGSLVAIGLQQRRPYVDVLVRLLNKDTQKPNWLLNVFEYNMDSAFEAPPHSVPREAVEDLIRGHVTGGLEVVDCENAVHRFPTVPHLTRYEVITYAITITQ